uniref:Uncharacterized protein n=1 Tax=Octopus bimaculoides TaxID=37653 RepID=A0A0L8HIR1_OCTBM
MHFIHILKHIHRPAYTLTYSLGCTQLSTKAYINRPTYVSHNLYSYRTHVCTCT